jgi:PhnB protein
MVTVWQTSPETPTAPNHRCSPETDQVTSANSWCKTEYMSDNTIRPKLVVSDAAAAIDFYRTTLGAELLSTYPVGDSIVFAELEILGCSVTLKDADDADPAPTPQAAGPILDVVVDDPDTVAASMIEGGAEIIFPIAEQPYGARGGRVRDPFGVQWLLQTPIQVTPEEWPEIVAQMQSED